METNFHVFWLCLDRTWPSVWIILEFLDLRNLKFRHEIVCVIHVSSGFRHEISNNKYANFEMVLNLVRMSFQNSSGESSYLRSLVNKGI